MCMFVCVFGSRYGVFVMFFILFVMVMFVEFVSSRLCVNIVVFILELYILLIVVVFVVSGSLVFSVVWCVGVWFWLVGSM